MYFKSLPWLLAVRSSACSACQGIYAGSCTGFAGLFLLDFETPSIWEQAELWSGRRMLNGSCPCRNGFWQGREALREHSAPALIVGIQRFLPWQNLALLALAENRGETTDRNKPQILPLLIMFLYFCRKTKRLGREHPRLCHPLSELHFHNSELVFTLLRQTRRFG